MSAAITIGFWALVGVLGAVGLALEIRDALAERRFRARLRVGMSADTPHLRRHADPWEV